MLSFRTYNIEQSSNEKKDILYTHNTELHMGNYNHNNLGINLCGINVHVLIDTYIDEMKPIII